jgi:hypothetical protein
MDSNAIQEHELRELFSFYRPTKHFRNEIYEVLSSFFGGANGSPSKGHVGFGGGPYHSNPDFQLEIEFTGAELKALRAGPRLTRERFGQLADILRAEFATTRPWAISRLIVYSSRPILGFWKYRNVFQLCPRTDHQTSLNTSVHRCSLEIGHDGSSNHFLNGRRTAERFHELYPVISFVLDDQLWSSESGGLRSYKWVMIPHQWGPNLPKVAPLPLEYGGADQYNFPAFSSDPSWHRLPRTDGRKLPGRWFDEPHELSAPEDADLYLDQFFRLNQADRRKFIRACYWMDLSYKMREFSRSASFLAVAQAVESVAGDDSVWSKKQARRGPGATKRFRDFLRQKVNLRGIADAEVDGFYDSVYARRSVIAHGKGLNAGDIFRGDADSEESFKDMWLQRNLNDIARTAIFSWLEEASTS